MRRDTSLALLMHTLKSFITYSLTRVPPDLIDGACRAGQGPVVITSDALGIVLSTLQGGHSTSAAKCCPIRPQGFKRIEPTPWSLRGGPGLQGYRAALPSCGTASHFVAGTRHFASLITCHAGINPGRWVVFLFKSCKNSAQSSRQPAQVVQLVTTKAKTQLPSVDSQYYPNLYAPNRRMPFSFQSRAK